MTEPKRSNPEEKGPSSQITERDRFLAQVREWEMIRAMGGLEFYKLLF